MSQLRVCIKCRLRWATGALPVCDICNKANALALAANCPDCDTDVDFDVSGRVVVKHEPGCRAVAEFIEKADALGVKPA